MAEGHGTDIVRRLPFPFEGGVFPRELGALVQNTVLSGELPALEVTHTEDNSWLVGDGVNDPNEPGAVTVTHIWHAIERNSSIARLASLPLGHMATRGAPGEDWVISRHFWPD